MSLRTNLNRVQIRVARRLLESAFPHDAAPLWSVLTASKVPTCLRRTRASTGGLRGALQTGGLGHLALD